MYNICPICNKKFKSMPNKKCCSPKCRRRRRYIRDKNNPNSWQSRHSKDRRPYLKKPNTSNAEYKARKRYYDMKARCKKHKKSGRNTSLKIDMVGFINMFVNATHCAICKRPFNKDSIKSPDRIDYKGHYAKDNIQIVHMECNRLKGTIEANIELVIKILQNMKIL